LTDNLIAAPCTAGDFFFLSRRGLVIFLSICNLQSQIHNFLDKTPKIAYKYVILFFYNFPEALMRTLIPFLTCVLLTFLPCPAFAKYSGGTGQPTDPYLISTPEDLDAVGANPADWGSHFLLINDINLAGYTGTQFNIIGNSTTKFTGVFDGNDHKVINLTIDTAGSGNDYLGLFGYIGKDRYSLSRAELKNLGVENINITGGNSSHCLGGLCGYNDGGRIRNCFSTGQVTGGYHSAFLGGLVGDNHGGTISNSYSTGSVSGDNVVGGLCGGNFGRISNCYSTGQVDGSGPLGGLTGNSSSDKISNCFWDVNTSGLDTSFGGIGKTTIEMQTMSTFTDAGWDFAAESANGTDDIWLIPDNQSYPILWFQASLLPHYSGGTGTLDDPFLISTPEDLDSMRLYYYDWDKHFLLTADINMAAYTYTTALIAPDEKSLSSGFQGTTFTGVFDGAGFKVINLIIDTAGIGNDFLGLFGAIDSTGTVENLGVEDVNITGGNDSRYLGGLVGFNRGTISNCFSTGSVTSGNNSRELGGLVGYNTSPISNCFSTASVTGGDNSDYLGGLVGFNYGAISDCYSTSSVAGGDNSRTLGGLVGKNYVPGTISNCYAVGSVAAGNNSIALGGLAGSNASTGTISNCLWDVNTSGLDTSAGGIGKTTIEMQTMSTFTDAGWDFTTPVWKICENVDYPRLAWEKIPAPVLYPEPDITTGTQNTITWQDVNEAIEYYAICCNDPNLEELLMDSGWLDANEVTFAGLDTGQRYYYAVKARQNCVMESDFSNVESSMQVTLGDAVDAMLDPNSLKNANMANALSNKIDQVLAMIDAGNYQAALKKLENDILKKTNGCANSGRPDKNDWIQTCQQQGRIYPLIMETIEYVESLME
jgi:hypothetical protein